MTIIKAAILAVASMGLAAAAQAGTFAVTATEGLTGGSGFDTASGNPFTAGAANTASATFTYTGPLSFSTTSSPDYTSAFGLTTSNISGYSGSGTVTYGGSTVANFGTAASFSGSIGSAGSYEYGSYYTFNLGTLAAGTILQITHDDGVALFEGGKQIGSTVSGPTTATTDTVEVGTTGAVTLAYSRQNGAPSILQVNVPEPASMSLLLGGLASVAFLRRKRKGAAAA